jgi:hypothetical protein
MKGGSLLHINEPNADMPANSFETMRDRLLSLLLARFFPFTR